MKNPRFGALHSPLPSQSEMQGRKLEEEIQQPTISHGCAKFRTPCETTWGSQPIYEKLKISKYLTIDVLLANIWCCVLYIQMISSIVCAV